MIRGSLLINANNLDLVFAFQNAFFCPNFQTLTNNYHPYLTPLVIPTNLYILTIQKIFFIFYFILEFFILPSSYESSCLKTYVFFNGVKLSSIDTKFYLKTL